MVVRCSLSTIRWVASRTSSQPVARVRAYQQDPGTNLILGDSRLAHLDMGDVDSLSERTNTHLDYIKKTCEQSKDQEWYVAAGIPVERFSQLSDCYKRVNHIYAYRYLTPEKHVLTSG